MLEFNHNPFVPVWVDYNGTQFFCDYDVRLKNGTLIVASGGPTGFSGVDSETIDCIKIILGDKQTPDRVARNAIEQFGVNFPTFIHSRQEFVYKKNLKPGEYIEPVDIIAWRQPGRFFGEFGRTSLMVSTGEIVKVPSKVGRVLRYPEKLWSDRSSSLLMPEEVKQRLPYLESLTDRECQIEYAKQLVLNVWPSYPSEYLASCAIALVDYPDVEINDDRINKSPEDVTEILKEIVASKLRWLEYRLIGQPTNEQLLNEQKELKELER